MADTQLLTDRLQLVLSRIEGAHPDPGRVTLVAVTKKFPTQVAAEAVSVGLVDLGENYAQELVAKATELGNAGGQQPRWHFIGGLQRNKIKKLAPWVSVWHTMDRPELLSEVAKRSPGAHVFVQVNTTDEPQKSGCNSDDAARLVEHGRSLGLDVRGLMTLGPTDGSDPSQAFDRLRKLGGTCEVDELSMGMSSDLEIAIEHGATMVRVGSALFGPRSTH